MSDLSVQQQKQLNLYLKNNPKVSREKAIVLLFGNKGKNNSNKGLAVEHKETPKNQYRTIYLQSGRKVVYAFLKDGRMACKYYGADGTQIKPEYFKKVEGNISISADGMTYTITKNGQKSKPIKAKNPKLGAIDQNIVKLNNEEKRLNKTKKEQGFIGKGWDWFKNTTHIGAGSDKAQHQINAERAMLMQLKEPNAKIDPKQFEKVTGQKFTKENLERFKKGELSQASQKVKGYQEGQEMAVDVAGDIVSGVAAFGIYTAAVAAAPFTGGASILFGVAAAAGTGALVKSGLKAADAYSGGRKYTFGDFVKDAETGAVSGLLAPVTSGFGGAIGKTVATKLGLQTVKAVGKEIAEDVVETGFKETLKTSLLNPGAYKYVGNGLGKKFLAYGSEIAADGAVNGAVDNGFRTAVNGGNFLEIMQSSGEGALFAPFVGGLMKGTGFVLSKGIGGKYVTRASSYIIDKFRSKLGLAKTNPVKIDVETVTANIKKQFSANTDYNKGAISCLTGCLNSDNAEFTNTALNLLSHRKFANYGNIVDAMQFVTKENKDFALSVLRNKNILATNWANVLKNADNITIPEFNALLKSSMFARTRAEDLRYVNKYNIDFYKQYYKDSYKGLINIIAFTNQYNKPLIEKILKQRNASNVNACEHFALSLKSVTSPQKKLIAEKLFPENISRENARLSYTFESILDCVNNKTFSILSKCIDSKKFSLQDIRAIALLSGIDTHTRMSLPERINILKMFNDIKPEVKKAMRENGVDIADLENFLKGKKGSIVLEKAEKDRFLKNVIANNNENKILKVDFSNTSSNDTKNIIGDIVAGIPEFKSIASTPKGVKTLQALQELMKSPEYKSFSDVDKTVCKFTVLLSEIEDSSYVEAILKNYKLGNGVTSRIIETLRNKSLVANFLDGKISEKSVVARIRSFSDYKTIVALMKSNPMYAKKFTPDLLERINNAFNYLHSGQKMMFTSHIQNHGNKFPKENYDGTELRVLNLNTLKDDADLSEYGFTKGTTPANITLNVHMTTNAYGTTAGKDMETMLLLSKDAYSDVAPSSTLIKGHNNSTYMGYKYGLILKSENRNYATFGVDQVTGCRKGGKDFMRLLFENKSNAVYKRSFQNLLNSKYKINLTDTEYIELMKQIQSKKYASQLKDIKIGDKVIKAEQLRDVINSNMNIALEKEVVSFNPQIEGIYVKVSSLRECPSGILSLAQKYNLPIILGYPDKTI